MPPAFVIPYVNEEPKRGRPFTPEMEKAAILCLSEARRRRPKILKGSSEEIDYIVKFHYPLWGVPWEDKCIVVDGLGLSSSALSLSQIPDVTDFTEDLKQSSVSSNPFRETLKKHNQTFRGFVSTKEAAIEAVVGEISVLESLSSLIKQAETVEEGSEHDVVLVPPRFPKEEAEGKAESLINEWRRSQTEVEALEYALEVLKQEVEYHKERILIEIGRIWGDYEERIYEMKRLVDQRIRQLTREKEKNSERATKHHELRMKKVLAEERKMQQKIEKLRRSLREYGRRRKILKTEYPKRSTTRVNGKIESYREKIRDLARSVRALSRLEETARIEQEETLRRIEQEYLGVATKEMEKLEILEESRNLETSKKREGIRGIDEVSSEIEAQVRQLMEQKTKSMKKLEEGALPLKVSEAVLIGVPFYLVQYKSARRTRIDVHPPVTAASYEGVVKKIQRAILSFSLEARIQSLLNPRSPELNDGIFASLRRRLETSLALREDLSDIGRSRNLLKLPNFKEEAAKGMSELEDEGWVTSRERETILRLYTS